MAVKLTYVFDAYCGWCYGFGPAVREFAAANTWRVDLNVVSGGLFTGGRVAPIGTMPNVAGANARIAELTGVEFGSGYRALVADGRFQMDSTAAATGFAACVKSRTAAARPLGEAKPVTTASASMFSCSATRR